MKPTVKQHKYYNGNNGINLNYIKNIEKYHDYNIYKPKKNILETNIYGNPPKNVVPNRKLSPLGKKHQLIKI